MDEKTLKLLKEKVEVITTRHKVLLSSIDFIKENNTFTLLVLLSKEGGTIELDDCVKVSEDFSKVLDELNVIEEEYILEVSTASSEIVLETYEDFKDNIDQYILVQVKDRVLDYDELVGYLKEVDETSIKLEIQIKANKKIVNIALSNIDYAQTYFKL